MNFHIGQSAVITNRHRGYEPTIITRETKTLWITATGARFRKTDGYAPGDSGPWGRSRIEPITPAIQTALKRQEATTALATLPSRPHELPDDPAGVRAVRERLAEALERVEDYIEALVDEG